MENTTSEKISVLVTGGTKGIGLAIAKRLAGEGKTLFLAYHSDAQAADRARAEIEAEGASVHLICGDVGTVEGAAHIMDEIASRAGSLNHIVHSGAMHLSDDDGRGLCCAIFKSGRDEWFVFAVSGAKGNAASW